jgi:hypothetical protein
MKIRTAAAATIIALSCVGPARAQDPVPPPEPVMIPAPGRMQPGPGRKWVPTPLKVTVVLSRYQGEKRVSSMPYVLGVAASGTAPGPKTTLRMGTDVPVVMTVFGGGDGKTTPQSSYSYRNVGTNIDCTAWGDEATAGLFHLSLTITDSSIGLDASKKPAAQGVMPDVPSFRNFNSSFTALLRDGQTTQYTSATDPVTGELMKIDVTLNVMK